MKKFFSILLTVALMLPVALMADEPATNYKLVSITPADSSLLTGIPAGDTIRFTTNFDSSCGGFKVRILDQQKGLEQKLKAFTSKKDTNGNWFFKVYNAVEFQKGHKYTVEITGYQEDDENSAVVAQVYATYLGDGLEYSYSDVTITSIAPSDGEEIKSLGDNYAIISFSDTAAIDQTRSHIVDSNGNDVAFGQFINVNDTHKKWQLIIPASVLSQCVSTFQLHIYATDKGGLTIKGNQGIEEDSYYEVTYKCTLGYPEVTVYPGSGTLNSLSQFTFSCNDGITVKDNNAVVTLYKADRTTVVESIAASALTETQADPLVRIATLRETVKEEGTYYLHIPAGVFALGSGALDNREKWVTYTLVDRVQGYGVTISPADGSIVNSLSQFVITFDNWDAAIPYYRNTEKITLTNANGTVVATATAKIDENRTLVNQCIISLPTEILTPGTYRLNIPDKAFIVGNMGNNHTSAMYFEYTVKEEQGGSGGSSVNVTVTTESAADQSLDRINLRFTDYLSSSVNITSTDPEVSIMDANQHEVAKGILKLGQMKYDLYVEIEDGYTITAAGIYTIQIPAGTVKLGSTVYQRTLQIEVPFNVSTRINNSLYGERREKTVKVYNLQGMLIKEGRADEVLTGLKGLYIVNGKKTYIR